MLIKTADYTGSFVEETKCPQAEVPEFAFIGRSNVGKSSLINYFTGRKKLSKVSVTPGKTQTLNFFDINHYLNFVDLPGYGYAKVSKTYREKWDHMIRNYILHRKQLMYVFLLIDSRVPPQQNDIDYINWLAKNQIPVAILFTKADKPGSRETSANIQNFNNKLLEEWHELPPFFVTSAEKSSGREKVLQFIENEAGMFYKHLADARK
jgi:GTP-binding protein